MKEVTNIVNQLKSKKFAPIYIFDGEEAFYIDILLKHFENDILDASERDFNLLEMYGKDHECQEVISNARRYPMFSEYILVIIKDAASLKNFELLEGYIQNPSPQTILVIDYRGKKLDKRSKVYKAIAKFQTEYVTFEKIKDNEMPSWIVNYGRSRNITIPNTEAEMLSVYLGNDLQKISNELDKVMINEPSLTELTAALIEKHIGISKEYNVIDLPTVVFSGDKNRLARMMAYFCAQPKNAPMAMLVGIFYSYINKLFLTHYSKGGFESDKKLGIWTFHRQVAQNYNITQIHQSLALLAEYNAKSRGVDSNNNDTALLKEFIGRLLMILARK